MQSYQVTHFSEPARLVFVFSDLCVMAGKSADRLLPGERCGLPAW